MPAWRISSACAGTFRRCPASAPAEVLLGRLASRTGHPFGKSPGELQRVLEDLRAVETLLRKAADHEIQAAKPLSGVVTEVLHITAA